jgi:transposase
MPTRERRTHAAAFKAQVALEAVRRNKTVEQIAQQNGVCTNLVTRWRNQLTDSVVVLFERSGQGSKRSDTQTAQLLCKIGELTMQIESLTQKSR